MKEWGYNPQDMNEGLPANQHGDYWSYDPEDVLAPEITAYPEFDDHIYSLEPGERLAKLRAGFEPYHDVVDALGCQAMLHANNLKVVDGYLGSGGYVDAFRLPAAPEYVVKLPHRADFWREDGGASEMHDRAEILTAGLGIERIEQIVTFSDDPGLPAVISRFEHGALLAHLPYDYRMGVPLQDYEDLAKTCIALYDHGLWIDEGLYNILHDPGRGFIVIDYDRIDPGSSLSDALFIPGSRGMLLNQAPPPVLPPYARHYRDVCGDLAGGQAADDLTTYWEQHGYRL